MGEMRKPAEYYQNLEDAILQALVLDVKVILKQIFMK
jgi:hypothetical protein